jgi:exopolysaccharide biosynthesis polyprenyl glycosylphosphotransferase
MSRDKDFFILWIHKLMDICLTAAAFITAYFIKLDLLPKPFRGLTTVPNYYTVLLMIIIIWYVTFNLFDLYSDYRRQSLGQIIWEMFKAVSTGMLILMFCMYIFKITDVSRIMMGIFYLLNIGLLTASRGLVLAILVRFRGRNCHNILVVGTRETAKEIIETIEGHQEAGCKVIGCLGFDEEEKGGLVKNGIRVVNTVDSLEKILLNEVVDELIFTVPLSEINEADGYIALAEEIGISVRILPDWHLQKLGYRPKIATLQLEEFFGVTTLALRTTSLKSVDLFIKSLLDYVLATVLLILFLPFLPLIALAIKYLDSGPVFFKQVRSGLNGRRFMFYKFRTMVKDAEDKRKDLEALNEADGPVFKIKSDPRIIKYIGTVLRRTALDELPQLINVLKGEMSLVGPRPPIPAEVEKYDSWQRRRLSMKPGMTCIWQTTFKRNVCGFEDWMRMDLEYIDNWSLWLDFKILLKTIPIVLKGEGR